MLSFRIGLAAFSLLPLALAQDSTADTSATTNATTSPSAANTTAATGTSTTGTTTAQSFTAPTVTGTQCGTAQQNFNQCVTKVAKDISACGATDNVCLCQTYANLAACYNACSELESTGTSYKQQSQQYCTAGGVSLNSTSSNSTSSIGNTTNSTVPLSRNTGTNTTTQSGTTTSSGSSSKASTFAAASGATRHGASGIAILSFLAGACAAILI